MTDVTAARIFEVATVFKSSAGPATLVAETMA